MRREAPEARLCKDLLEARLNKANGSIQPESWLPSKWSEMPQIRVGKRLIYAFWAIPPVCVVLVVGIAVCQGLYKSPWFRPFLVRYPAIPTSEPAAHSGRPLWLRLQHLVNLLFMAFIIRLDTQILADHPRLYWQRECTSETGWFRFQQSVPKDSVWTSKDDLVTLPRSVGIPGIRHSVGPARWWHFAVNRLWVFNGAAFYGMLFATDQWHRLVPATSAVFPNALSMVALYWLLHFAVDQSWMRCGALQQLTHFFTMFIAAPLQIGTRLMQGPAIANGPGWLGKSFNRQRARAVPFLGPRCHDLS